MRSSRFFTGNGALNPALCGACCIAGFLCLVSGIFITTSTLERLLLLEAGLGATLLLGGVFLVELARWLEKKSGESSGQKPAFEQNRNQVAIEVLIQSAVLQALVILLFAALLDGGVRLQACLHSDFGYWAGALLVLARRRRALTGGDLIYLRWGWLPIIVIGVALFVRVWTARGLI